MGAVPALPTRKSTGVFLPAVRDVLSVPAAEPILRSWVPLRLTFKVVVASKAPARARIVTGLSAASARAGVSISTLKVSEAFSLSWIEEIWVSPNCGLKRTVQPWGGCATKETVNGFGVSFLRSTVNLRFDPTPC